MFKTLKATVGALGNVRERQGIVRERMQRNLSSWGSVNL